MSRSQLRSPLPLLEELSGKPDFKAAAVTHVEEVDASQRAVAAKNGEELPRDIETVALVVGKPKDDFELTPIVLDEIRSDEVLVEMRYSGICHTDLVLQQGLLPMVEFPAIFGHEGAGTVVAVGSDVNTTKDTNGQMRSLQPGDSVLLSFNTCGECRPCKTSHPAFCHQHAAVNHNAVRLSDRSTPARIRDRVNDDGAPATVRSQYFGQSSFSKHSIVNAKCCVKPSNQLSDEDLALYSPIGCGLQTGAGTVLNVLKPGRDESIVVFGLGSVGLAALMAAKYLGVETIIAVDIVHGRLELAKELGATHVVNSREVPNNDIAAAIRSLTPGINDSSSGASYALECTGLLPVIESLFDCIGPQGSVALVGVPPAESRIRLDPLKFLLDNKRLIGVIEGDSNPPELIPKLVEMHKNGQFPIEKLVGVYPVERMRDAVKDMCDGKVIKPVLDWRGISTG